MSYPTDENNSATPLDYATPVPQPGKGAVVALVVGMLLVLIAVGTLLSAAHAVFDLRQQYIPDDTKWMVGLLSIFSFICLFAGLLMLWTGVRRSMR